MVVAARRALLAKLAPSHFSDVTPSLGHQHSNAPEAPSSETGGGRVQGTGLESGGTTSAQGAAAKVIAEGMYL